MTVGNGIVIGAVILAVASFFLMLELHHERQRCIEMWRAAYEIDGAIIWVEAGLSGSAVHPDAGAMAGALETFFGTTFAECRV